MPWLNLDIFLSTQLVFSGILTDHIHPREVCFSETIFRWNFQPPALSSESSLSLAKVWPLRARSWNRHNSSQVCKFFASASLSPHTSLLCKHCSAHHNVVTILCDPVRPQALSKLIRRLQTLKFSINQSRTAFEKLTFTTSSTARNTRREARRD